MLTYLAVPYSDPDPIVRQHRFDQVNRVAARLIGSGQLVFSPISHSHHISIEHEMSCGWEFWKQHDEYMLSLCSKILVLMLDGWKESVGVQAEITFATEHGISVEYMEFNE